MLFLPFHCHISLSEPHRRRKAPPEPSGTRSQICREHSEMMAMVWYQEICHCEDDWPCRFLFQFSRWMFCIGGWWSGDEVNQINRFPQSDTIVIINVNHHLVFWSCHLFNPMFLTAVIFRQNSLFSISMHHHLWSTRKEILRPHLWLVNVFPIFTSNTQG